MPWLLATLTVASALAGPAYADSFGGAELQEAEAMLAAEVPDVPMEAPPELPEPPAMPAPEPVAAPAPEPPSEPVPTPVEAPEPEPSVAPPADEAVTFDVPDPAEEVATEPPAYIPDEPTPAMPAEEDAEPVEEEEEETDAGVPPVVVPVNLNVDIRILSPGNDGDVNQVIDLGGLGLGGGDPSDPLGGLGDLDLGLDWTWNWNWEWDCGDASVAGLDWNWTWTWSGDCAAGILDEPGHRPPSLGDHLPGGRHTGLLDTLTREALGAPPEFGDERGPLVGTRGSGGGAHPRSHRGDDSETAPAPPPSDGGPWVPADALTSFVSTGATSQSKTATAPARRPAGADPNGDPERKPAGPPAQTMGVAAASGGGGGGGAGSVLLLAALVGALALLPPPPGGRVAVFGQKLSSLLSSLRLERPG